MIAHVVLFRPRAELTTVERDALGSAFLEAVREIEAIRQVRVGRRVTHGRGYEHLMAVDYTHAAILEFDDVDGLNAYLEHPVHGSLAQRFFSALESALMYDYDLGDHTHVESLTAGDVSSPAPVRPA